MILHSSRPNSLFALVAHFENPEQLPREVGRFLGFEESCERARFMTSVPGVESVVVCEVLENGELGVGEACFQG
jgi:hypothetical protein